MVKNFYQWMSEMNRNGGKKSSAKLSAKQRKQRAKKAARARWGKKKGGK